MGRTLRTIGALALGGALFAGGYVTGRPPENRLADAPVAPGFLDVPNGYRLELRQDEYGAREAYLVNDAGGQWPLVQETPALLGAYDGAGKHLLDGAVKTIETTRRMQRALE